MTKMGTDRVTGRERIDPRFRPEHLGIKHFYFSPMSTYVVVYESYIKLEPEEKEDSKFTEHRFE